MGTITALDLRDGRGDVAGRDRRDAPMLIVHGRADRILSIDGQGRRLQAALPDACHVETDGGPHVLCVDHRAEVDRELLALPSDET